MDDTQGFKKIEFKLPPVQREESHRFHSKGDYELYQMMCDQIDAGVNCDFYRRRVNQGFVKMPNGDRKQYFRK